MAKALREYFFVLLARRGIRRMDARIDLDNYPSIRSTYRSGYRIEREGPGLFATVDVPDHLAGADDS